MNCLSGHAPSSYKSGTWGAGGALKLSLPILINPSFIRDVSAWIKNAEKRLDRTQLRVMDHFHSFLSQSSIDQNASFGEHINFLLTDQFPKSRLCHNFWATPFDIHSKTYSHKWALKFFITVSDKHNNQAGQSHSSYTFWTSGKDVLQWLSQRTGYWY